MNPTDIVDQAYLRTDIPSFRPGDTVRVHARVVEGGKERVQIFQGVVIRRQGGGLQETFTVRKISFGVGVERTFPVHSPTIAKFEVVVPGKVRRAKLYYLRELTGRKARIRERRRSPEEIAAEAAALEAARQAEAEAERRIAEAEAQAAAEAEAEATATPEGGASDEAATPEAAAPEAAAEEAPSES